MKVYFFDHRVADCTADPHEVSYDSREEMLNTVQTVLESELVSHVTSVEAYDKRGKTLLSSDKYSTFDGGSYEPRKKADGEFAKKHKVGGLYYYSDPRDKKVLHLPPGLTGYKELRKWIQVFPKSSGRIAGIHIGVIWAFAGDSSCADYIKIKLEDKIVDFSNQDWWLEKPGYVDHCRALSALIGSEIEPTPVGD